MTNDEYKLMWHRFQIRYENYYTSAFEKALQKQLKQYIETKDLYAITSGPIYTVLLSLYKTVGPAWVRKTGLHKLKVEKKAEKLPGLPMGFSEIIVDLMRQYYGIDLLNDAELMTAYSRQVIVDVLSSAAASGLSFDEIVRILIGSPEFTKMRARRIARTETVTASNGAAMIQAKRTGILMKKEWLSVMDSRTRDAHYAIDGTVVGLTDPFNVGGELLQQPGVRKQDNGLSTSAWNVVNCRCTMAFKPQRDKKGNLILA